MREVFIPGKIQVTPEAPLIERVAKLTPQAGRGYAEGGDIFMPEPGRGEHLKAEGPKPASTETGLTRDNIVVLSDLMTREDVSVDVKHAVGQLLTEVAGHSGRTFEARETRSSRESASPDTAVLSRAKEVSPELGSIASSIKSLEEQVNSGAISEEQFVEKSGALRASLSVALLRPPSNEDIAPDAYDRKYEDFARMQNDLSYELTKLGKKYEKPWEPKRGAENGTTELRQTREEAYQAAQEAVAAERRKLMDAYLELDELIAEAEQGRKRATWDADYEEQYKKIDEVVMGIDYAEQDQFGLFNTLASISLDRDREGKEHYGYALEHAIERIIGQGDVNPTGDYPQFGLTMQSNLDDLIQSSRRHNEGFFSYLYNLRGKRVLAHTLFQNMKDRRTFVGIAANSLDPGGIQFIESQVGGVSEAQLLIEKELARMAAMNSYEGKGWILHDQFRDVVDKNISKMINSKGYNMQRQVRKWTQDPYTRKWVPEVMVDNSGRQVTRKMRDWEKSRADRMAASVSAAGLRRQTYGVVGDAPHRISQRVETVEGGEEIMTIAQPLKLVDERYFIYQHGSKRYLENWHFRKVEMAERNHKRYSLTRARKYGDTKDKFGIFGASERATVLMDTGTVDVKSSMWRVDQMFFQQKDYANVGPNHETIGEYLQRMSDDAHHHAEAHFPKGPDHKIHGEQKRLFNESIRDELSRQRLFVGALMKRGDISNENKQIMWQNTAKLLPSRIASLMPQFSMDEVKDVVGDNEVAAKEMWDNVMRKLFVVEYARVQDDAEGFRVNPVTRERVHRDYQGHDLQHYINIHNSRTDISQDEKISLQEMLVISKWQRLGQEMSGQLSEVIWTMTPFMDDAPKTAWNNMGRDELKRLLVNDHNDWEAAYKGIHGLMANPAQAPQKFEELAHAFVESGKSPTSLLEAQELFEPFLVAYLRMGMKYDLAKWTVDASRIFRKPTSEMEEFNLQSGISFDEEEMANLLYALAKIEVVADDPKEADAKGQTQLIRLTHEMKADLTRRMYMYFRFLALLLPAYVIKELTEAIMPDEVLKAA